MVYFLYLFCFSFCAMVVVRVPGRRIPRLSGKCGAAAARLDDLHWFPAQTRTESIPDAFRFRNTPFYPSFSFLNPV